MRLTEVRVQKLFVAALILKVLSSGLGWWLRSPWLLGLTVPLVIMGTYVLVGLRRSQADVSDDKFADSCYYLGFIFTITSIIFSLFDLPNIGSRLQDIAVRFGAAMISTVIGLAVRVYLVSFREEASDALQSAEDGLIEATHKFREQLVMVFEKLRDFEAKVDVSSNAAVERVQAGAEKIAKDFAAKLDAHFEQLAGRNTQLVEASLGNVDRASGRLTHALDTYALGLSGHIGQLQSRIDAFSAAVSARLAATTFPDDFFSGQLQEPVNGIKAASEEVAKQVAEATRGVTRASAALSRSIDQLAAKSDQAGVALDSVAQFSDRQQAIMEAAKEERGALAAAHESMMGLQKTLAGLVGVLEANNTLARELHGKVSQLTSDNAQTQSLIRSSLSEVAGALASSGVRTGEAFERATAASTEVSQQLQQSIARLQDVSVLIANSTGFSERLGSSLDASGAASQRAWERMGQLADEIRSVLALLQRASAQAGEGLQRSVPAASFPLSPTEPIAALPIRPLAVPVSQSASESVASLQIPRI